jgi:hypothetical protein
MRFVEPSVLLFVARFCLLEVVKNWKVGSELTNLQFGIVELKAVMKEQVVLHFT